MRAVVQRVKKAKVSVDGRVTGEIQKGLLVFLGISTEDSEQDFEYIFHKILKLRIFDDEKGVMNQSILDQKLQILLVSQFTLYGDGRKGNRPSYIRAAKFEDGKFFYQKFIEEAKLFGVEIETGEYGADMEVELINDGPVTILLDSEKNF